MHTVTNTVIQVHTVKVYDITKGLWTAARLRTLFDEVKHELENEWGVTVVGFTSDAGGDSHACHVSVVKDYPAIIGPDCYAHQVLQSIPPFGLLLMSCS